MKISENSVCLNRFAEVAQDAVLRGAETAVVHVDRDGGARVVRGAQGTKSANERACATFCREVENLFGSGKVPPSVRRLVDDLKSREPKPLMARHVIAVLNEVQILRSRYMPQPGNAPPQPAPASSSAPSPRRNSIGSPRIWSSWTTTI